jgi:putative hemolysin
MSGTHLALMVIPVIVLLGLSAFFSGSETALMAISKLRLKYLAETRPGRAKLVERILAKPERLIGTILLGNNLVNVAMSALATAAAIAIWGERGIAYVTAVLTFAILIFAEITPKVYAKYYNERVSFITAPVLNAIMIALRPAVAATTFISSRILLLMGVDVSKMKRPLMTEAEVQTCIKLGWDEGAITTEERLILSRVFTLNDKTVGETMIPKEKMTVIPANSPIESVMATILKTGHSRFPISENGLDITGFIHAKDLFKLVEKKRAEPLRTIVRPPYFVPSDRKIDAQLRSFKARKIHQAIVLDAEGKTAGLITLEDILEELVGSIQDEYD